MSSSVVPVEEKGVERVESRSSSKEQNKTKGEKEEKNNTPIYEEGISAEVLGKRLEASGISDNYERKVFILNKVMNEHIGRKKKESVLWLQV